MARVIKRNIGGRVLQNNSLEYPKDKVTPMLGMATGAKRDDLVVANPSGQLGTANAGYKRDAQGNVTPLGTPIGTQSSNMTNTRSSFWADKSPMLKNPKYKKSDEVLEYRRKLKEMEANKPQEFQSKYTPQIENILNTINTKGAYNVKDDTNYRMLYDTMAEQYKLNAERAMRDSMANASTLTGGYGNSYAQSVAQQAYDNQMNQLNARNVDLMNMAYGMYRDSLDNDYRKLGAFNQQDNIDYGRYRDKVGDYQLDRNYLADRYNTEHSMDYGQFRDRVNQDNLIQQMQMDYHKNQYGETQDGLAQENLLKQMAYQKEQDEAARNQWMKEFEYKKAQDALAQANYEEEKAYNRALAQMAGVSGGGSGGGGRSSGGRRSGGRSRYRSNTKAKQGNEVASTGTSTGGYAPYVAKVETDYLNGVINQTQAYTKLMNGVKQGLITNDMFGDLVYALGIDEMEVMNELAPRPKQLDFDPLQKVVGANKALKSASKTTAKNKNEQKKNTKKEYRFW